MLYSVDQDVKDVSKLFFKAPYDKVTTFNGNDDSVC